MIDSQELIVLAKQTATEAAEKILSTKEEMKIIEDVDLYGKEVKIKGDKISEIYIINKLKSTGIPILSEESEFKEINYDHLWIVDPIDGSFNFNRNSGPSAISIGYWEKMSPVFGVIFDLNSTNLYWGGVGFGSWMNNNPITTSKIDNLESAILSTGIPARFNQKDSSIINDFNNLFFSFSKIRMFGSAAYSLSKVAEGVVDAYWEYNIMLWDVAAGIPIVQGAGGKVRYEILKSPFHYVVAASNNNLFNFFNKYN